MSYSLNDTMTDTAGVVLAPYSGLTAHVADDGSTYTIHPQWPSSGRVPPTIDTHGMIRAAGNVDINVISSSIQTSGDEPITFDLKVNSLPGSGLHQMAVLWRCHPTNAVFYLLAILNNGGVKTVTVYHYVNSSTGNQVGTQYSWSSATAGNTYAFQIIPTGANTVVKIDGTTVLNVTDGSPITWASTMKVGVGTYGTDADGVGFALDNLKVGTAPVAPATAYSVTLPAAATAGTLTSGFALVPNGTSSATVTLTSSVAGDVFSPATVTFDGTTNPQSFSLTTLNAGARTISGTNVAGLTNGTASYTPLRYSLTDATSGDGNAIRVCTPWDYSSAVGAHVILYTHGSGETQTAITADSLKATSLDALLLAGYIVAGSNQGGNNWGNSAGISSLASLRSWLVANRTVRRVGIWSQSMGGLSGLLTLAAQAFPVAGWYGIFPCCSLANMDSTSFAGAISTAYGGDYAGNSPGHDPLVIAASSYPAGLPMRFTASPGDAIVSKSANTDAMIAHLTGRIPNLTLLTTTGDHGDPSNYVPSDQVAFWATAFGGLLLKRRKGVA